MTVIRPNSISGVSSITGSGGDISIFRADGTAGDLVVNNVTTGIVTATTFVGNLTGNPTGSGANLTNLPAGNLTGNLPAISAANLTSIPAANITGTLPAISATNLTNVPAANITGTLPAIDGSALTGVGVGTADSINTSGIVTATAFVPTQGQLSHRNIIINGDMMIAQRDTSHGSSGYRTVDRFSFNGSGLNASVTTSQADVAAGTTPYTLGFRKSHKIVNGAQTGPDAGDHIYFSQKIEAQNMATSGWNYLSSSSNITLSFWVKSSVAQNFYGYLITKDGSSYLYPFETGSLSADTWTKVTKTVPGNSNLTINNDNGTGLELVIAPFFGTSKTGSVSLNAWGAYNSSVRVPDMTSTWYTTNGATFEYTAVQLEVGFVATPFEHISYAEQLSRCQRYYQKDTSRNRRFWGSGNVSGRQFPVRFDVTMRDTPSVSFTSTSIDSGSLSANGINTQGYYTNMSGSGRFYEWQHTADAEL